MFNCRFGIEENTTPETSGNKRELTTAQKIGIGVVVGAAAVTVVATAVVQTGKAVRTIESGVTTTKNAIHNAAVNHKVNKAVKQLDEIEDVKNGMRAAGCDEASIDAYIAANYS